MRSFDKREEDNITFLVSHNVDFTMVQVTATGLKKSILDATVPMRTYFLEKDIHNFSEQLQGQEHKHYVKTFILNEDSTEETKTSLYRPVTKRGDPRMWVAGMGQYTRAGDIYAICVYNKQFYVINITRCDIARCYASDALNPIKEFVSEFYTTSKLVSDELLYCFMANKGRWFESEVTADTGIGRTIETMLGIQQNSFKTPDYKGIELKSHREKRSSRKNVLFTQTPEWELSKLKSGREIVRNYGYDRGDGRLTYQNTVQCSQPNSQGLGLTLNQLAGMLELQHFGTKVDDVAVWTLMKLHQRLSEKHHETFWISVDNEIRDGKEFSVIVVSNIHEIRFYRNLMYCLKIHL